MTRINSAINVQCLTDEHLLAEHREIKRLPFCLCKAIESGSIRHIPERFLLGKGHVTFFLDKMMFTLDRYRSIHEECKRRGMEATDFHLNWLTVPTKYMGGHIPTPEERQLLVDRITDRITHSKKRTWHYYGKAISKNDAVELLTQEVNNYITL